ncbi:MAG TPA: hypothetical protein VFS87_08475 [Qipengyuania sp.]|nr:hypothetical protein [Qipengyuania sp.]
MSDSHYPGAAEGAPPPHSPAEPEVELRDGTAPDFTPVPVRYRYDGWVPDKQLEFIERLADCGCVDDAARAVGMSRTTAYALRRRPDAQAFRMAWDAALDASVARLRDAALARAIHGVAVPIFHGGEQVGERRHFDERLTMFLLRYRDPTRYGKWLDTTETSQHSEGPVMTLAYRTLRMARAAWAAFEAALDGKPAPEPEWDRTERSPHSPY